MNTVNEHLSLTLNFNMKLFVNLFLFFTCTLTEGKKCIQNGPCKCTFDDGSGTVDLSPIGRQDGTPLIYSKQDPQNYRYAYSFNPCFPVTVGTCVDAAACQEDPYSNIVYNIGDSKNVTLSYNGFNVIGTYVSDDGKRSSTVSFLCDPNADPLWYALAGEISTTLYGFTITSKYACPSSTPTPTPTPTPGERCFTDFGEFKRTCSNSYDGNAGEIKVLIVEDWDGSCKFPANVDVAVSLHNSTATCDNVNSRCNPKQAFSVNGYVCKGSNED